MAEQPQSPLSFECVQTIALQIDGGGGPSLGMVSAEDRAAILGAVVRLRERRRVGQLLAQAECNPDLLDNLLDRDERRAERLAGPRRHLGSVDGIVADILTSPEGVLLLNLLSALVSLPLSVVTGQRVMLAIVPAPFGVLTGWRATDRGQVYCLRHYLDWRLGGSAEKPWPVFGPQLRAPLRAWVNSLHLSEARLWADNGLPPLAEIEAAGLNRMAVYERAMDCLGVPLDGLHSGVPFGLPADAAPLPKQFDWRPHAPELAPKPRQVAP
ncbi:MAG: hypothetical protein H7Y60_10920 [Rhodospirillaceae bacterium]|nr:hypothetical protein [Rhodospirillales bacterium]